MKVLYMTGYSDGAMLRHGALWRGLWILQNSFTPGDLAHKV